jgi:hypothetical protein
VSSWPRANVAATTEHGRTCGHLRRTTHVDEDTYSSNNITGPVKSIIHSPDVTLAKAARTPEVEPGDCAKRTITVDANGSGTSGP